MTGYRHFLVEGCHLQLQAKLEKPLLYSRGHCASVLALRIFEMRLAGHLACWTPSCMGRRWGALFGAESYFFTLKMKGMVVCLFPVKIPPDFPQGTQGTRKTTDSPCLRVIFVKTFVKHIIVITCYFL